ncbi:M3 family metallopeptidase [Brevibacterium salitolerans]|uniref:Peptidyl-dipeptidase Dcp n=1 Tax=Brevibacterium salitolerans TaxID=1403566 RepID=A0ABN2WNG9_9MICO
MTQPPTVDTPAGNPHAHGNAAWEFVAHTPDLALPDFAALTPEGLREACARTVAGVRESVSAILASTDEPAFTGVTLPLERAKLPARALAALVRVLESNVMDEGLAEAVADISSQLTSLRLSIELDEQLFERLSAVSSADLIPEDRRLHEHTLAQHVRAGVRLPREERETVAEISRELDRLETEFGQTLLRETAARAFVTDDPAALAGLSEDQIAAAEAAAAPAPASGTGSSPQDDRTRQTAGDEAASGTAGDLTGDEGTAPRFRLPLTNTSQQDALTALTDPESRRRLLDLSLGRGSSGGPHDTRALVADITALRAAQAAHLGFHSYAQYAVDDSTAGDVDSAGSLLHQLLEPALRQFEREARRVRDYFGMDEDRPLERHDVLHLWERYRAETFEVDAAEASAHFEFERVLTQGVFATAQRLYGLAFSARTDLHGWHPDVRVYEVLEGSRTLGLVLVDPFARPGKRGGAWMDELVTSSRLTGLHPVTTLTLNVPPPAPGRPALLTPDETITLFHEFGHVLHGLFADSSYPSQAGTAVPRDYVEFPSQQFEMWALHSQVLPGYAVHWQTGEPMPQDLVERLRDSQTFGQGFATLEYLAAAMLDLSWHSLEGGEVVEDVLTFEAEVLSAAGFDPLVPPRYRSAYFAHIFSNGYAAGYYSYLWSEQYAAAVSELFEDHGGLDPELGRAYREEILAPGYSRDPLAALERFLGGEVGTEPLLRRRGLAPARPAPPACPEHARLERDLRAAGISTRVQVHPEPLPTAQAAADFHGVPVGAIANSLVFIAEFPDEDVLAERRAQSRVETLSLALVEEDAAQEAAAAESGESQPAGGGAAGSGGAAGGGAAGSGVGGAAGGGSAGGDAPSGLAGDGSHDSAAARDGESRTGTETAAAPGASGRHEAEAASGAGAADAAGSGTGTGAGSDTDAVTGAGVEGSAPAAAASAQQSAGSAASGVRAADTVEDEDELPVREEPVLIMTSGSHRVDTAFTAEQIGAVRLKRATPEQVLAATGQAVGGVAPAGHPSHVRSFVDRTLREYAQLWAGGGTVEAMVPLTYAELVRVTQGEEIDVEQQ